MLVFFGQLTHRANDINQNRRFPLACGFLASYLASMLGDNFEFDIFKTPRDLDDAISARKPDVLMLSNYMWNENLACAFAERVRKAYDDVLIIIGGPNFSLNEEKNIRILEDNPAIDKIVFHEGEIPGLLILEEFAKHKNVNRIRRTSFPGALSIDGDEVFTGSRSTNSAKSIGVEETRLGMKGAGEDLDAIPSPYLSGYFDKLFKDGEVPLIETNRGCPFKCTFCQQGTDYFNKVRNFNIDRVCSEIEYIAKKIHDTGTKIDTLCIADPNFAMFKRDGIILDVVKKMQDLYGYPKNVICSTGKNKPKLIIENTSKLTLGSILLRSAVQSLDEKTLEAIDRSNIKLDAYEDIQKEMTQKGLESNADLMLGLPCETRSAHFGGIYTLIDTGVKEIACLQTIALKGTVLEENSYVKKYGIKTKKRVIPACYGNYRILGEDVDVVEFDEIIIGNDDLSFDDYLSCRRLHLIVMVFHNTRLMQPIYLYLDRLGINRSEIIRNLYLTENKGFNKYVRNFIKDTKDELFENFTEFQNSSKNFSEITSNKIFRNLSIALYLKKKIISDALQEALLKTVTGTIDDNCQRQTEMSELIDIFNKSIVSPFDNFTKETTIKVDSELIKDIFGDTIVLGLSEKQSIMLATLSKIFSTREAKINRMAYHLKPANLSKQILSSGVTTTLGDASEYVVE